MIAAFIKGQNIKISETDIVAETINFLKAQFIFTTSHWNGLEKTAYFTQDETTHSIKLDENNIAFPIHLASGEWSVCVVGREYRNGELVERITTDSAMFTVKPFKVGQETPFPEPMPTEIENIRADIGNLSDLKTRDKTNLVNAINEIYRSGGGGSVGGSDGFSPIVEVEPIEGGHKVTITDVDGEKSFDVFNGVDGYTPIKGVDYFDGLKGDPFTYEDFTPEQLEALKGKDGNDYVLTETDKTEIANAVLEVIPDSGSSNVSNLKNLKCGVLGDSITYGYGVNHETQSYPALLKADFKEVINYGVSSTLIAKNNSFSNAMCERYVDMADDLDVIVVMGGTNDFARGSAVGTFGEPTSTDPYTFCGALNVLMSGLINKYVGKEIFFCTPIHISYGDYNSDTAKANGKTLNDYRNAIIDRCAYYSIPCIDLFATSGMDIAHSQSAKSYFTTDGCHPNVNGHIRLHDRILHEVKNRIGYDTQETEEIPPEETPTVESISAIFNQGDTAIYTNTNLDSLKGMLTVTATYTNGTTANVTNYTLSGTLTVGTSIITVNYGSKTTTFTVSVSESVSGDENPYTFYEYLQGQTYSYIDTGVKATQDTKFEIEYNALADGKFGVLQAYDSSLYFGISVWDASNYWCWNNSYTNKFTTSRNTKHIATNNNGVLSIDGNEVSTYADGTFTMVNPLYLFACNKNGTYSTVANENLRIYYCKIWDGNTLVRDFVPAKRNTDNAIGMYDKVTNTFFANAGTGTFGTGEVVTE